MTKNLGRRKLSRTSAHRKAMLRNMATSLFLHENIKTTLAKAKELASYSQKLISKASPLDLSAKKAVMGEIKNKEVQKKIFEVIVPRYKDRPGGYTQIFKLGLRTGDRAEMVLIKLMS